jgi:hypothetical protein
MSEGQSDSKPSRSVTPPSDTHGDTFMDLVGLVILGGLLVLLLPILPFLAVIWLFSKATDSLSPS